MSQNILLTSLSPADSSLPVRFFSLKNEFGFNYCAALLDTEASIKAILAKNRIDEIVIIGSAGSYQEGEDLRNR